jgi:hypothetical protein
MPEHDVRTSILLPLAETGLRYMVTGGLAAIIYGDPRLTNDVDIVLQLQPSDAAALIAAFPFPRYYTPPIEVIQEEAARPLHGHFNILDTDTALRGDIYCLGTDALGAWAFERRRAVEIGGSTIQVAPIEYVIVRKLEYFRAGGSDRHLRDVAAMRRISGGTIDAPALDAWIARLGLEREWRLAERWEEGRV